MLITSFFSTLLPTSWERKPSPTLLLLLAGLAELSYWIWERQFVFVNGQSQLINANFRRKKSLVPLLWKTTAVLIRYFEKLLQMLCLCSIKQCWAAEKTSSRKGVCDNDSQEESTQAFVVALKDGSFQYSQKGNGQKRSMWLLSHAC